MPVFWLFVPIIVKQQRWKKRKIKLWVDSYRTTDQHHMMAWFIRIHAMNRLQNYSALPKYWKTSIITTWTHFYCRAAESPAPANVFHERHPLLLEVKNKWRGTLNKSRGTQNFVIFHVLLLLGKGKCFLKHIILLIRVNKSPSVNSAYT